MPPGVSGMNAKAVTPAPTASQVWEQWAPFFWTRARLDACLPPPVRALPARMLPAPAPASAPAPRVRSVVPSMPSVRSVPVAAPFQPAYTVRDHDVYCPTLRDSLFWTFFMMKQGILAYEQLQPIFLPTEKEYKYASVERLRHEKKRVTGCRLASLAHLENQLANETSIDLATFLVLCQVENLPCLVVRRQLGYVSPALEDMCEEAPSPVFVVYEHLGAGGASHRNVRYGYRTVSYEEARRFRASLYVVDNLEKPLRSLSYYKSDDLVTISQRLGLPVTVTGDKDAKRKTKTQLYEAILQYVS